MSLSSLLNRGNELLRGHSCFLSLSLSLSAPHPRSSSHFNLPSHSFFILLSLSPFPFSAPSSFLAPFLDFLPFSNLFFSLSPTPKPPNVSKIKVTKNSKICLKIHDLLWFVFRLKIQFLPYVFDHIMI